MAYSEMSAEDLKTIIAKGTALQQTYQGETKPDFYYSPAFLDFLYTLDTTGFNLITDYDKDLKTFGYDINDMDLTNKDLDALRLLMTAHLRIERFVSGHIQSLIDKGFFESFLTELAKYVS
jgi:hypothetical protein